MSILPAIVYVVDDDPGFAEGLEVLLRGSGLESRSFCKGESFLQAYPGLRPGCVLVDLAMPGMDGLELLRRLRAAGCQWPVVILTGDGSASAAMNAMAAGAFAFLMKPPRELEVLAAARKAQAYLNGDPRLGYDEETARRIERLPRRQREVLDGVMQGLLNKQIAGRLGIRESTVKRARRALMGRLRVDSRTELIVMALRGGVAIKGRF